MLPNNQVGYYVIAKDCDGKVRVIRFYEALDSLVRAEKYLHSGRDGCRQFFSESLDDRVPYHWDKYFFARPNLLNENEGSQGAYVVIDHTEKVVPLCELNRVANQWLAANQYSFYGWRNWRRVAYGQFRFVKTTQEKRAYYATLDQEVPIKVRGRRKPRSIPDSWDDLHSHNDKCWKTQSKRRHQWKDRV